MEALGIVRNYKDVSNNQSENWMKIIYNLIKILILFYFEFFHLSLKLLSTSTKAFLTFIFIPTNLVLQVFINAY